jgi:hypothetical protein
VGPEASAARVARQAPASRPVSISSTAANCPVSATTSRTPAASWTTSRPSTLGPSGIRSEQRGQRADEGRLPRAVRSQQAKDSGLLDVQVDPRKRRRRPEALDQTPTWTAESGITHPPADRVAARPLRRGRPSVIPQRNDGRTRAALICGHKPSVEPASAGAFRPCSRPARGTESAERPTHPVGRGARRRQAQRCSAAGGGRRSRSRRGGTDSRSRTPRCRVP